MTTYRPSTSIHQTRMNKDAAPKPEPLAPEMQDEENGSRLRVLPVIMVVSGLFLGFKLASIYDESEVIAQFFGGSPAVAQVDNSASEAEQNAAPEEPGPEDGPQLGPGRSLLDEMTAEQAEADAAAADAGAQGVFDPTSLTQSEVDLLQSLAERRDSIRDREAEVELRENLLQATEQRIDEKISELRRIEETISSLIETYDEQQEEQLRSLVRIYETMKPKAAAAIFETLDMQIMLDVVERMKEARLALIMQQVTPGRAQEITTELRARRQLPGEITGG